MRAPRPGPGQRNLDVGERSQAEYDFIAEAIGRHEAAISAEQLRQAAREPYHPSGPFGAFTESDLCAADAAGLTHGELRVWLVHILEFGAKDRHTTAAEIVRAKAKCGRNVYANARRKLIQAGLIEVRRRWRTSSVVRRPHPRLPLGGGVKIPKQRVQASEDPETARPGTSEDPETGPQLRVNHEKPPVERQPPWRSDVACGCGRQNLDYKPNQDAVAPPLRLLDAVCKICHSESGPQRADPRDEPRGRPRREEGAVRADPAAALAALRRARQAARRPIDG